MACSCGRIMLGSKTTEHRNWNPSCVEHGVTSDWWHQEGRDEHRKTRERSVELQRRAREAREQAHSRELKKHPREFKIERDRFGRPMRLEK